jgi:hypothetical protein
MAHGVFRLGDPDAGATSRVSVLTRARELGWHVAISHFVRPFGSVSTTGWRSR